MKFPYKVKHNGVYYPIGADVPIETNVSEGDKAPAPVVSGKVEAKEEPSEKPDGRKYSEEDLNVGFMKLKALCKKEGLVVHPEYKSKELKEMLRKL